MLGFVVIARVLSYRSRVCVLRFRRFWRMLTRCFPSIVFTRGFHSVFSFDVSGSIVSFWSWLRRTRLSPSRLHLAGDVAPGECVVVDAKGNLHTHHCTILDGSLVFFSQCDHSVHLIFVLDGLTRRYSLDVFTRCFHSMLSLDVQATWRQGSVCSSTSRVTCTPTSARFPTVLCLAPACSSTSTSQDLTRCWTRSRSTRVRRLFSF